MHSQILLDEESPVRDDILPTIGWQTWGAHFRPGNFSDSQLLLWLMYP
jgi:hypothetical protein